MIQDIIDKEIKDPLKAAHEIGRICQELDRYVNSMFVLRLGCADQIEEISNRIYNLSKTCATGIMRETNERFKDSQKASANVLNAILPGLSLNTDDVDKNIIIDREEQ